MTKYPLYLAEIGAASQHATGQCMAECVRGGNLKLGGYLEELSSTLQARFFLCCPPDLISSPSAHYGHSVTH